MGEGRVTASTPSISTSRTDAPQPNGKGPGCNPQSIGEQTPVRVGISSICLPHPPFFQLKFQLLSDLLVALPVNVPIFVLRNPQFRDL